jgi:hypothetical protein
MTFKNRLASGVRLDFIRANRGMAAAEFGLLLPLFLLAVLGMIDVGTGINERMKLDQTLRVGAQLAMSGVTDTTKIESASMASGDYSDSDEVPSSDTVDYSYSISKTCECSGAVVSCSTMCGSGDPPSVFYNLNASKTMQTIILPTFSVGSAFRVQVR